MENPAVLLTWFQLMLITISLILSCTFSRLASLAWASCRFFSFFSSSVEVMLMKKSISTSSTSTIGATWNSGSPSSSVRLRRRWRLMRADGMGRAEKRQVAQSSTVPQFGHGEVPTAIGALQAGQLVVALRLTFCEVPLRADLTFCEAEKLSPTFTPASWS